MVYRAGSYPTAIEFPPPESLMPRPGTRSLFVLDDHTRKLFPSIPESTLVLESGETQKDWTNVDRILRAALEAGLGRDGNIVGIGGGVICDTAAFAASIYMRGCRLILIPTTLLAMVDAAFGGKTGINLAGLKNMVGTFYPASEIRISTEVLGTLPEREYRSGLAEVIKSAMLADANLFHLIVERREDVLSRNPTLLEEIVRRSLAVKAAFVEADPTERGIRAHLNLGHTFAHAVESGVGLGSWTHGEAVAWGICRALDAGVQVGLTDPSYREEVVSLLDAYGYRTAPREVSVSTDALIELMTSDKKKRGGTVRFVLQRRLCDTLLEPVDTETLRAILS